MGDHTLQTTIKRFESNDNDCAERKRRTETKKKQAPTDEFLFYYTNDIIDLYHTLQDYMRDSSVYLLDACDINDFIYLVRKCQ